MRLAIRLSLMAVLFIGTIGVSASSDRRAAERLEDTYAVLSRLLDRPAPGQVLLEAKGLADPYAECGLYTLVSDGIQPLDTDESNIMKCLEVPDETRRALAADWAAHRHDRLDILSSRLSVTRPYGLMTASEFENRHLADRPVVRVRVEVGYVYFNADRTIAAVRASLSCRSLGSEGGWQVFERQGNGSWQPLAHGGGCTWVS
jgi:hypothetical protein